MSPEQFSKIKVGDAVKLTSMVGKSDIESYWCVIGQPSKDLFEIMLVYSVTDIWRYGNSYGMHRMSCNRYELVE